MQLCEEYRPKTWAAVLGQAKVVAEIATLRKRGLAGRAFFISGKSGQGKTTIARLLAADICGGLNNFDLGNATEYDAKGMDVDDLKDIDYSLRFYGTGLAHGRCAIINEVHTLTPSCIKALLTILERPNVPIPNHAAWIFTTTLDGFAKLSSDDDAAPFLSRCTELQLTSDGLSVPFARQAREVATRLGLNGQPESAYVQLVEVCNGNMRKVYQFIEKGGMVTA